MTMVDYRRDWIKERVTTYLGLNSEHYFEDAMNANEAELEEGLTYFLDNDISRQDGANKRLMYFYRVPLEKLIEEEVMVPIFGEII